jgi:hypothetical protein
MCTGFEYAMLAGSAVSTALGVGGAMQQAQAAQNLADYNAKIAANDAIAAQQKAKYEEDIHRRQIKALEGKQRASIAATGGELLDAQDVIDATATQAEMDALAIRYGGATAAEAARQRGFISGMQGQAARSQSYTQAGQTLLTGATSGMYLAERSTAKPKNTGYTGPIWSGSTEGLFQ